MKLSKKSMKSLRFAADVLSERPVGGRARKYAVENKHASSKTNLQTKDGGGETKIRENETKHVPAVSRGQDEIRSGWRLLAKY